MKRSLILAGVLAALAAGPVFASHIPVFPQGLLELDGRLAAILTTRHFDPLLELQGRLEDANHQFRYRALTAGSYLRLHRNLKVGAFYRLQAGARHDDDWIAVSTGTGWAWRDTRSRLEQVLILDVSPRFLLDFLPGRNWVLMLKGRYQFNTFNLHHSILAQPTLTYFLMHEREPLLNFSLSYGLYFPLNFGSTLIYEHSPYAQLLYHLTRTVKLELTGAYRTVLWSTSRDVRVNTGATYTLPQHTFVLGLGVLLTFSP